MVTSQRELRTQLESISQLLGTRLREIENRIDERMDRVQGTTATANKAYDPDATRPHVKL